MTEIMGIDGGNFETKVACERGVFKFNSAMLDDYNISSVNQRYGNDDMLWKYDGVEGIAGTIATYEGSYGENRQFGESKNHWYGQMRILLAIHQFAKFDEVEIVIGQPFTHHQKEKEEMIEALQRVHPPLTVNGITRILNIKRVNVSIEGAAAFYSANIQEPVVRVIDLGSGTTNCITFKNGIMVKDQSTTLPFGTESKLDGQSANITSLVNAIHRAMSKVWKNHDKVYICGGITQDPKSLESFRRLYSNIDLLKPLFSEGGVVNREVNPQFANAVGLYRIARNVYSKIR